MDDVEIVVAKRKPLGQAKALKILSKFLKKDQAKEPEEQLPADVLHQLQTVRDSLRGPGATGDYDDGEDGEEEQGQEHRIPCTISVAATVAAPAAAAATVAAAEADAASSPEKKRKKKKQKDDKA